MTDAEIADLLPGVSYARSLADGIALRCHPQRNPPAVIAAARSEALSLARLIDWSVLPLLPERTAWPERKAYERIQSRLARFGGGQDTLFDYPEEPNKHQLLLDNFDELARRVEAALAKVVKPSKKGGAR